MITKEQYMGALTHELNIIKHLATKVKPGQMSYKPTEKQRTLGELMQYLTYVYSALTEAVVKDDKDIYMKHHDAATMPTLENFAELMDKEIAHVTELVTPLTEEQLNKEVDMWVTRSVAMHLLHALQNATAYKMQMFLYMKASGTENIGTMNVWAGMDAEAGVEM